MPGFLADVGRSGAPKQLFSLMRDVESIKTSRILQEKGEQETRALRVKTDKVEADEAYGNERLTFNAIRTMVPGMGDNQFNYHLERASLRGYDIKNNSLKRSDVKDYFAYLGSTEGSNDAVKGATIELNDTRQGIADIDEALKTETNEKKAAGMNQQRGALIAKENVLVNSLEDLGVKPKITKPEMTPTDALGKIAQAQKAKESFLATGGINPAVLDLISRDNPELARIMQGSADKEVVSKAFDDYITSLEQFTGGRGAGAGVNIEMKFARDPAMQGNTLGAKTEHGHEVKDEIGKLIGYYN